MKRKLSLHVILVMMLSLLLIFFTAGCNSTEVVNDSNAGISTNPENSSTETISDSKDSSAGNVSNSEDSIELARSLADYDGWWYIDEDSHDGVALINIFHLDAQTEKYTVYNEEGFQGATLKASKGKTGELILDLDILGEVSMVLLDEDTLKAEGGMIFRKGDQLPEPDYSSFAGVWYERGNEKSNYYRLTKDGYYEYYDVLLNAQSETVEACEKGTYTFSTMIRRFGDSKPFESLCLTLDDGSGFITEDFYLLDNGLGLLNDSFDKTFYIRSDVLGTASGEDAISICNLVQTNLWHGEDGNYLSFTEDGMFKLSQNEDGRINPYDGGAWSLTGEELTLVWDNGVREKVAYQVEDDIFLSSLNEIFTAME